jgi:hypothetical protein
VPTVDDSLFFFVLFVAFSAHSLPIRHGPAKIANQN